MLQRALFYLLLCSITLCAIPSAARTWYIKPDGTGDAPTIQAGIDSTSHGDTLLCTAGVYSWANQGGDNFGMLSILRGSSDMTIVGESGANATILDGQFQGRIFFFQGETELTIDGFTFRNGVAPPTGNFTGGAFAAHLSSPVIKNSIFRNNNAASGGAYWYGGQGRPRIENCLFENNTSDAIGGAVRFINSAFVCTVSNCEFRGNTATTGGAIYITNVAFQIEDCVFIRNEAVGQGGAIRVGAANLPARIERCTIYESEANTSGGIGVVGGSVVDINNCIIAKCGGSGAPVTVDANSTATLSCTDLFGNSGGNWVGDIAPQNGVNGNFSLDPLFCAGGALDLTLRLNSPCAPGNHPNDDACGLIGALPTNCGSVPTEEKSWGAIKSLYH